ncbi:hypothetical protein NDN08_001895 [Rhodosorus marinus]|uniref:SPX domain-containing protein n=1 Tax=Rhodosorus marinus TaxID=101924 RepID=A0AAV8US88_9RHOD|nr:hypothetical protein NDN08_001895 [Rhodosorus marinus]
MKWGKALNAKVEETPEWSPYFLNFKSMKKELKAVKEMNSRGVEFKERDLDMHGLTTRESDSKEKLLKCTTDAIVPFLDKLNAEIATIETFFVATLTQLEKKLNEIERERRASDDEQKGVLALREINRSLNALEEFSRLNYISAAKILKKLDKSMESEVKTIYITEILNVQTFHTALSSTLRNLSERVDAILSAGSDVFMANSGSDNFNKNARQRSNNARDLNNDVETTEVLRHVSLCVPLRRTDGELEVLVVTENDGSPHLVKAHIEAGETSVEALLREMSELAGLAVGQERNVGEYLSTTKKNTVYYAYTVVVERELEDWPMATTVRRRWLQIDELISELEDNTGVRVLRKINESPPI